MAGTRILLIAALLGTAGMHAADAAPTRPPARHAVTRTIAIPYTWPCAQMLVVGHPFKIDQCDDDAANPNAKQVFAAQSNERFISLEILDDSGKQVGLTFGTGAISRPTPQIICGKATRLPIDGTLYVANPTILIGSDSCPDAPTSGTIKVTLWSS